MNTKKVTVTERFYDEAGNMTKEVVTETEYGDTYTPYQPWKPPAVPYITY